MTDLFGALAGSIAILATWILLVAVFVGIGLAAQRAYGIRQVDGDRCLLAFWTGLAATVAALQLVHFLTPIRGAATMVFVAAGAAGLAWVGPVLGRWITAVEPRELALGGGAALGIGLVAAHQMLEAPDHYGTGLHLLPMLQWIEAHPLVPGLANLQPDFGSNHAGLLYAALLDQGFWAGRVTHLGLGLLLFAALLPGVRSALRWVARPGSFRAHDGFALLLAPLFLHLTLVPEGRGLAPEVAAGIVALVAAERLFRVLAVRPDDGGERRRDWDLLAVGGLVTLAACFDLAVTGFAVVAWVLVLGLLLQRSGARWRSLTALVVLTAVLALPWLARGVVLSGRPAYPSPRPSVAVAWRVPAEQAVAHLAYRRADARTRLATGRALRELPAGRVAEIAAAGEPLAARVGVVRFAADPSLRVRYLLPAALAAAGLLLLPFGRARRGARAARWLALPAVAGLAFWYVWAPDPGTGYTLLYLLAATLGAPLLARRGRSGREELEAAAREAEERARPRAARGRGRALARWGILGVLVLYPVLEHARAFERLARGRQPLGAIARALAHRPGPDMWFHPPPEPDLATYLTDSGLVLRVPDAHDRPENQACWDAPPPCTPHPAPNLERLDADDPASGFRVRGAWHPLDWPYPGSPFLAAWRGEEGW